MVPILHIHHRFIKPSVWLIISPSSSQYPICCIVLLAAFTEHGGFHSVAYVVLFLWCELFVTSQLEVIFMFPNQLFDEV